MSVAGEGSELKAGNGPREKQEEVETGCKVGGGSSVKDVDGGDKEREDLALLREGLVVFERVENTQGRVAVERIAEVRGLGGGREGKGGGGSIGLGSKAEEGGISTSIGPGEEALVRAFGTCT